MNPIRFTILLFILGLIPSDNQAQIADPVPGNVLPSGILFKLETFVTIPPSAPTKQYTRINMLREVPDGSGRLFVNDLRGQFWVIVDGEPQLFTNIADIYPSFIDGPGKGTGFGCFAFHPEFAENGLLYTAHSEMAGAGAADYEPIADDGIVMQWILTEWACDDPASNAFTGTRREILRFDYPGSLHGMQEIVFNPTVSEGDADYGNLYICMGDGGSSLNFLEENLQTTHSFMGTILRINPLGDNGINGQYGIPADNPFAQSADDQVLKEIFAYGFRNPHRISWDSEGEHLMIEGDIGEKNIEEVNIIEAGKNYGWSNREGTFLYDRALGRDFVYELPDDDSTYNYTYPVAMYDHDEGLAIVGGYVYRRNDLPEINGHYIFGDIPSGRVYHVPVEDLQHGSIAEIHRIAFVDENGSGTTLPGLVDDARADLRFGVDSEGVLYLLTKTDGVIRIMRDRNATNVDDISNLSSIMLTPNPSDGLFKMTYDGEPYQNLYIEVLDVAGKVVYSQDNFDINQWIDLTKQPDGTYFLHASDGSNKHVVKIIKHQN